MQNLFAPKRFEYPEHALEYLNSQLQISNDQIFSKLI